MVEFSDLSKVNALYAEAKQIEMGLRAFDAGAPIGAFVISGMLPDGTPSPEGPVMIPATDIAYPPAMVDAIRNALTARVAAINNELAGLGVTGAAR